MRIGNLRHQVVIQRQSTTPDAVGQLADSWSDVATRFCSLEPLNGREYFQASGEHSEVNTRIRFRYDPTTATIKPYDRIVDRSSSPEVRYDVEEVINPHQRNRELVLMCRRNG